MKLRKATGRDTEALLRLYRACADTPYCKWDEDYPNEDTIGDDLRVGGLYLLQDEKGLLACASVTPPGEEELGPMWEMRKNPCALSRIGVSPERQGQGVGGRMLRLMLKAARAMGYDGMRLLVSPSHPPAIRLYRRAGFRTCGMCAMWGLPWVCMERKL